MTDQDQDSLPILGIGEARVYVSDLDSAENWYNDVLELETTLKGNGYCFLRAGNGSTFRQRLILFDPSQTKHQESPPPHGTIDNTHIALGIRLRDLETCRKKLEHRGIEIEDEITWPSGDRSIYFRDPDGNSLELYGEKES